MSSDRPIRICVAGATGWTGGAVTQRLLHPSDTFRLVGVIARQSAARDIGEALDGPAAGIVVVSTLEEALAAQPDVLIDYTTADSVKARTLAALAHGLRVVIGTAGLTADDYQEIDAQARQRDLGVIAAGNFSLTAAVAKHYALIAAQYLPSWEIIDYAQADKLDAPSGTTRELAEELAAVASNQLGRPIDQTHGAREARGAAIDGTPIHAVRLPSYVIAFETIFGLPDERLTIRHDAGTGAEPYVGGTLLAAQRVMALTGLVRGLDRLLFASRSRAPL
jgi:4-hydroxy-tetrahydrodipicolinate reductase